MTEAVLPESVKAICYRAFYGCSYLSSIKMPSHLEIIGPGVLDKCHALTEIDIGACRNLDGAGLVFGDCRSLARVYATGNTEYAERDGVLYDHDYRELVFYPRTRQTFDIPPTVAGIGPGACWACRRLKSVRLPVNVKRVAQYAFNKCDFSEFYSEGVVQVSFGVFRGNPSLTRVTFPASLSRINTWRQFIDCPKLREVVFLGDAPVVYKQGNPLFGDTPLSLKVVVQRGSKGWKFKGSDELPEVWPLEDGKDARSIHYVDTP